MIRDMAKRVSIPTFALGTYRSMDGSSVTFTEDLLRTIERNTNFVIARGVFRPTVGYDHPVYTKGRQNTDAHGHIVGVTARNGVLSCEVEKPSDTLRADVAAGRRLAVSGEFDQNFSFVDETGKTVNVGPTIVGLAALGRNRPAIKNPRMVPLDQLNFGDAVAPAEAFFVREELRAGGLVSQTFDGDAYAFSEITLDPASFGEPEQERKGMDEKDLAAITNIVNGAVKPIADKQAAMETQIAQFSETSQRTADAKAFAEALREDKKHLGKVSTGQLIDILSDTTIPEPARVKIKAFAQGLSGVVVPAGRVDDKTTTRKDGDENDGENEPAAIAKLRPKHFADLDDPSNAALIDAGITAFAEFKPEAMKDAKSIEAQIGVLKAHVTRREAALTADA